MYDDKGMFNIGKLAIGSLLLSESEGKRSRLTETGTPFVDVEHCLVGTDHAEVGALIVEEWGLLESLGAAARWHPAPNDVPRETDQTLVDLVHVADGLAHMMGFGVDVGELKRKVAEEPMLRLEIKVQDLETIALETAEQIKEMGEIFRGIQ